MLSIKHIFIGLLWIAIVLQLPACAIKPFDGGKPNVFNAQKEKTKAVKGSVKDSKAVMQLLDLALAAAEKKQTEQATQHFEAMMQLEPKSEAALNHYAIFLRGEWRIDESEQAYLTALKYSPNSALTHYNLAILYELYRGDYARAIKHYQLYQQLQTTPDKLVTVWLADLERRQKQ